MQEPQKLLGLFLSQLNFIAERALCFFDPQCLKTILFLRGKCVRRSSFVGIRFLPCKEMQTHIISTTILYDGG